MSALSSKKTDSYGKDSFDDDISDSLIEAEELDLDDDSTFEDDEIIAAALDFYDSNFKLSKFIESKENSKELRDRDEDDEEEDDLNQTTMPDLPEINFDNIDLEPKPNRALSAEASCEEIEPEDDVQSQVSYNEKLDNRSDKLSTNRSATNSIETANSIEIKISSRRPSSFNSDNTRYSFSFEEKESTSSIPRKVNSRLNLSFSNDRVREIERHNKILLQKILAKKPTVEVKKKPNTNTNNKNNKSAHDSFLFNRTASAAINRKKEQNKIDYENQILKRKLEAIALGKRKNKNRLS